MLSNIVFHFITQKIVSFNYLFIWFWWGWKDKLITVASGHIYSVLKDILQFLHKFWAA